MHARHRSPRLLLLGCCTLAPALTPAQTWAQSVPGLPALPGREAQPAPAQPTRDAQPKRDEAPTRDAQPDPTDVQTPAGAFRDIRVRVVGGASAQTIRLEPAKNQIALRSAPREVLRFSAPGRDASVLLLPPASATTSAGRAISWTLQGLRAPAPLALRSLRDEEGRSASTLAVFEGDASRGSLTTPFPGTNLRVTLWHAGTTLAEYDVPDPSRLRIAWSTPASDAPAACDLVLKDGEQGWLQLRLGDERDIRVDNATRTATGTHKPEDGNVVRASQITLAWTNPSEHGRPGWRGLALTPAQGPVRDAQAASVRWEVGTW